jgi:hypothetical protein
MQGVDPIFIVPWFLLIVISIVVAMWKSGPGYAHGFKIGAITLIVGVLVLMVLYFIFIMVYIATGGH